jgi:beta-lactam-binding protein with PASTA domain/tRNA A-37 threonylcarbamoyl transferase component Bud32
VTLPRDRLIGTRIEGRYRIDAVIARGGMSTVYMGLDLRLGRPVAIKVMEPKYAEDRQFVARFEFEARAVAGLKDPGLVSVYDQGVEHGIDGDLAYMVMELVPGGTLRELLAERGPMPPHAVAAVLGPVLGALGTAHRAGLVHRDVKPENVLIAEGGEVKIADFGLVRAVAAASVTSNSVILGTAAYLSPEQVETGHADARSDVYSAGVMAYELLTGEVPFTGDTPISLAYQRLHNDVPAPSAAIAGVPRELDDFIARATARDPERRYADGTAMAKALADIATELHLPRFTVPAPAASAEQRTAAALYAASHAGPIDPSAVDGTAALAAPPDLPGRVAVAGHPTRAETLHEHIPAERTPPRRRARSYLLLVLVLVIALLLAVGGWFVGSGRYTAMPQLVGLSKAEAEQRLDHSGLHVNLDGKFSDAIPENNVTGQQPAAGARVSRFPAATVTLSYSKGKPTVPNFQPGASVDDITKLLTDNGLTAKSGQAEFSRDVELGKVVRLEPAPGTRLNVGATVTVIASAGNYPVNIPDVRGKAPDAAKTILQAAGISVKDVKQEFDAGTDAGQAFGTDPSGQVDKGGSVTLLVSNALTVPDVTGKSPADAEDALTQAGLTGELTGDSSSSSVVTSTSPAAGTRVAPTDTRVTVTMSAQILVPSVTGMSVGDARSTLTQAGFKVKVNQTPIIGSDDSRVILQSPGGGDKAKPGSTVTVTAVP